MDVKTLMIGDWVSLKEMPTLYMRVRSVLSNGSIEVQQYEGHPEFETMGLAPERISPIPLTPVILEKNGFHMYEYNFRQTYLIEYPTLLVYDEEDEDWTISIECEEYCTGPLHGTFKYVNEFQHFLKVFGIEKEIVL